MIKFKHVFSSYKGISAALYLISALAILLRVEAQAINHNFQNATITLDDGLSENFVDYIYKDSEGFMWFATWAGLDRYDGYTFTHYSHHDKTEPITSNFVKVICEDNFKRLWLGTEEGINIFDLRNKTISTISLDSKLNQLPITSINTLYNDHHGNLWIGSSSGICKIHFDNNGDILDSEIMNSSDDLMNITSVFEDSKKRIWLGTSSGVITLLDNKESKGFHLQNLNIDTTTIEDKAITDIEEDKSGNIWIATNSGLYKYNINSSKAQEFSQLSSFYLPHHHVNAIAVDKDNNLWIGTLAGVCYYKINENILTTYNTQSISASLNNNFINSLFIDENNIIWIGTEKGGVNKLFENNKKFKSYLHDPNIPTSLAANPVNAVCQTSYNELWVGNVEGGLNKLMTKSGEFKHYYSNPNDRQSLSHNAVSVIFEDSQKTLWIGTWGMGLNRYQRESDNFERNFANLYTFSIINNLISAIAEDKNSQFLWVGTPAGINLINRETKEAKIINTTSKDDYLHEVNHIICDRLNRVWIATNYGLYCFIVDKCNFETDDLLYHYWPTIADKSKRKAPTKINSIHEAQDGTIWFGTYGDGVFYLPAIGKDFEFICLPNEYNLNNKVIYSITEDLNQNLWFGTNKGLTRFAPIELVSKSYTKSDGLINNQMYWNAAYRATDGTLYFGSTTGLIYFNPEEIKENFSFPRVRLTRLVILNKDIKAGTKIGNHVPLKKGLIEAEEIHLREQDNSILIEFSALSYLSADKITYAYKLEGFDKEWNEVGSDRRFASYTNLQQGTYRFVVKCTNSDGVWSDILSEINIKVTPPFYQTVWFLGLTSILFIFTSIALTLWRIRYLRLQNITLETKVKERTSVIEKQNSLLEKQAQDLEKSLKEVLANEKVISQKNLMLIQQNEEILNQKTELEELSCKIQEINQERIRFFINISHEFRTPITLILGPIEQLLNSAKTLASKQKLEMISRNANRLLSLINQLMDFRKVESGNMQLSPSRGNLSEFTKEITTSFSHLADTKKIKLLFQSQPETIVGVFDRNKYQMVITNIISNAVKFTPNNGTVSVTMKQFEREKHGLWTKIQICDTGAGIPEKDLERIFERFFQSQQKEMPDTNFSGTGIGLFLAQKLIELHNGKIEASNLPEGGSCFTILMPLQLELEDDIPTQLEQLNVPDQELKSTVSTPKHIGNDKPLLLLVEDASDMRQYIASIFENDYYIIEAENGEQGLKLTQEYLPDFIISDIMMPIMDGITFCKNVKSNFATSHIPVLLLTARTSTEKQIESFDSGANAFVTKPFEQELLLARVNNLVESRKRLHDKFRFDHDPSTLDLQSNSPNMKFMQKALNLLKIHYTDTSFDVATFVSEMGMSRSLLHKKLQSLTGESASKFIRTYRLNIAKSLMLKHLDKNISEIAYEVGFNDPKYFTRCFTKQFGQSPRKYLEENQSPE